MIDGLRREETQLEVHDLLPHGVAQGIDGGGMAECGAVGLIAQIEMNRLAGERLAPIPHYRCEEAEVGRRQRTTEERQLVRRCVPVRIVDLHEVELPHRGNADADTDEPLGEQHVVGVATRVGRRDIRKR